MKIIQLDSSCSQELKEDMYSLVNRVYKDFESRLWGDDYERVSKIEFEDLLANQSIIACLESNHLLGLVKYIEMNEEESEFGMLVTDYKYRGKGVASSLVKHVEDLARKSGKKRIRLEILKPVDEVHEDKERLDQWYSKIGYVLSHKEPFEVMYPHLSPIIKIPCDFLVYYKEL